MLFLRCDEIEVNNSILLCSFEGSSNSFCGSSMDLCQPGTFCYHLAIKIFNKALIWLNFWLLDIINLLIFNSFLGPGEISFSLNFNRERQTLIVHIREVKDIKLPAGKHSILTLPFIIHAHFRFQMLSISSEQSPPHSSNPSPVPYVLKNLYQPFTGHNFSHVYLKTYIVPDHKKATKCKTPLYKLGRKVESQISSSGVTNWDGEEDNHRKRSGKHAGQKLVSSLKRGTGFSLKKKKDKEQGNCCHQIRVKGLVIKREV